MPKKILKSKPAGKNTEPILGIYEARTTPITLGGVLTFMVELQTRAILHKNAEVDLCFVAVEDPLSKDKIFLSLVEGLKGIREVLWKESMSKLIGSSLVTRRVTWPDVWDNSAFPYSYDSTIEIRGFFEKYKSIPHLSCRAPALEWSAKFLKRHAGKDKAVVVHLKNNPEREGESNANFPAWEKFFVRCKDKYPVKFILIGNEKIPATIKRLDNVVVTQDLKSNLVRDLALIEQAFLFMGMSSGPSNMAIYSKVPYIIFKNPQHHTEQMQQELGDSDRFNFASPVQKFLRTRENDQKLITEFEEMYTRLTKGKK